MSFSLDTPCATTSFTQEVDVYEYTWDLYTTTSVNAANSTISDTYTTTSYASTSSSSDSSTLPQTFTSLSYDVTSDSNGNSGPASLSYSGCFVSVEPNAFTTYATSDMVSSISLEQSTYSSSYSSSSYYEDGNTYTAREITTTEQVIVTTSSSFNTFSGYDPEGAIILPHWDPYNVYGTSVITIQSSTSEESSTSSSTSESESWSGIGNFPYIGGDSIGNALFEGTTFPSLVIFDNNSSYGAEMFPQYDTSSIHPNVVAPVSYLSFTAVKYSWVDDPYVGTSTTFPNGLFSQSDSDVFVLKSSTTTESHGETLTVWETTSSTYTLTYTIDSYTSTFNSDFSKTILGGGQTYSLTFDVGFYEWTINGQTESTTDSCSFSSTLSVPTTTTSTTYEVSTGGYTQQTYGDSDAGGTTIIYTTTSNESTSTWVTNADQGTNYDTTSSSASWSGLSFPDGITTSSSSSTSGETGFFLSNIVSAGVSSTEIVVPYGSVFVFSALPYYSNSLNSFVYARAIN
jgi:hypothetical protein